MQKDFDVEPIGIDEKHNRTYEPVVTFPAIDPIGKDENLSLFLVKILGGFLTWFVFSKSFRRGFWTGVLLGVIVGIIVFFVYFLVRMGIIGL